MVCDVVYDYYYDEGGNRLLKLRDGKPVAAYVEGGYLSDAGLIVPVKIGGRVVGILDNGTFELLATDPRGTVIADRDGTPRPATPTGILTWANCD